MSGSHPDPVQRRTMVVLVAASAVGALGITIGIATASLLARDLSGSEREAGLAQTFQVFGTAVAAYLLARVMAGRGRRIGLGLGYLAGAAGAAIAVVSGVVGSMPLLLFGALLLGATSAANAGSRYAATDLAPEHHRARALSVVVWATTLGAVLGPNLTGPSSAVADLLGIPELTGPFALAAVGIGVAGMIVTVFLRPDPLLVARDRAAARAGAPPGPAGEPPAGNLSGAGADKPSESVLHLLRRTPVLAAAMVALAGAHAVMVSVMVMTPLHMEHGGSTLRVIGMVISVHVAGMFALSPVMGWAADRFGRARTVWLGGVVLLVSLALCGRAPTGSSPDIFAGLFLLGLGWSAVTVAASTLVTDHTPLAARTQVQGGSDMLMSLTAAVGGGLSGVIVAEWGYPMLNLAAALLAVMVLGAGAVIWRATEMVPTVA